MKKEGICVIQLTKINGEKILVNPVQIEFIESIPESKIIMMNDRYHIVSESQEEIMELSPKFYKGILDINRGFVGIKKDSRETEEDLKEVEE